MKKIIFLILIIVLCLWIAWGDWTWPIALGKIGSISVPAPARRILPQPSC